MSEQPPEEPTETGSPILRDALLAFTGCMGQALSDICSYGLTIGESYVPFDPDPEDDCEEGEVSCSQVWVRVIGVTPFGQAEGFGGDSCSVDLSIDLEVGVLRCIDIPEGGEAPTASDVLVAAMQAMDDMVALQCAALNCTVTEGGVERPVFDKITLGNWVPLGPLGGQYGGSWSFTVEL